MFTKFIFLIFLVVIGSIIIFSVNENKNEFQILLQDSGPYIGATYPNELGLDGSGIIIGVIDTGVDHTHPDLFGFGQSGKVIGGTSFIDEDEEIIDAQGHGTQVAGIIAADGQLTGIAPKAKIIAYRVSQDGEFVSAERIVKAVEQAIKDDVDIINISLGVNKTNSKIDDVLNKAVTQGIVVITAAGNNGPNQETIGSPGINPNVITVGATYNNITSSVVTTLSVNEELFQILPMRGSTEIDDGITAKIDFGGYGRELDLEGMNLNNSILLVERGSDVEGELLYFSTKEKNAADHEASAILVYNNKPGIFLGELIHEFVEEEYQPRIPTFSMDGEDGLKLKQMLENKTIGTLNVFYHPDYVAHFSSRGPVSPFYIKPDLVAPGVFVNSTGINGNYTITSGTSYAAPHVSGAAALLLQKNNELLPNEIKSILVTTSDPISSITGDVSLTNEAGSGRINVTKALDADLIISPTYLTFFVSPEKISQTKNLEIKKLDGIDRNSKVIFEGSEEIDFDYIFDENLIKVSISYTGKEFGQNENKIILENNGVTYQIPVIVYFTQGTINTTEEDGKLIFEISHPDEWSFAKITIINEITGEKIVTSSNADKKAEIAIYEAGIYWIEAQINSDGETFHAYDVFEIKNSTEKNNLDVFQVVNIPEMPIYIILIVIIGIVLIGLKIRKSD